ncbi:MAG TPA: choice-of-anchor D domain-containing protein [Thermoanaerobaculia bacterium]|nr:choice-of-anchor D domain-containing protein [Thermoanaerobaculia bacterium]
MSRLDISIRGLRVEESSRRQRGQRLVGAFALLVVAALATGYSRGRMAPIAALGTVADFGLRPVGEQSPPQTLEVRNAGRGELRLGRVGIEGDSAAAFFLPEESCSHAVLAAGGRCDITVAFLPRAAGPSGATLTVEDNSADSPHSVALTGAGTGEVVHPPEPHADPGVEPAMVALSADVRTTAAGEVSVTNRGDAPLNLLEVSFSGDRGDFEVDQSGCAAAGPLGAGERCKLVVRFTPRRAGTQSAKLMIAHDTRDTRDGPLIVSLEGQGIGPQEGYCCIAGQVLALDVVTCTRRQGQFALQAADLEGRCERLDPILPRAPEGLTPGVPSADHPQDLSACGGVLLQWGPVADSSQPVEYLVTLENGRGKSEDHLPTDWGTMIEREVVPGVRRDVSPELASILDPKPGDSRAIVAPPLIDRAARLRARIRSTRDRVIHGVDERPDDPISFPHFRWRVSARDAADNEGPAAEWVYFRCVLPPG